MLDDVWAQSSAQTIPVKAALIGRQQDGEPLPAEHHYSVWGLGSCNPSYPTVPNRWRKFWPAALCRCWSAFPLRHGAPGSFQHGSFQMIEDWFLRHRGPYETVFVRDPLWAPEGAGIIPYPRFGSNPFLVLNGDSFCEIDPQRLLRFQYPQTGAVRRSP